MVAAVAGTLMFGATQVAMADNNDDIIYTLMAKGVLTPEEGHELLDKREKEREKDQKSFKNSAKFKISDVIDNATLYGDIRVRAERRDGTDMQATPQGEVRDRFRYKLTGGIKTTAGDFYTDLAVAMGSSGRSDNATFGSGTNGQNAKETLYVKRAMVGWKITDWATVEGGRTANPLYTNSSMVWDADLTFEGLNEQFKYKLGNVDLFATMVQSQYLGDHKVFTGGTTSTADNFILAFQGGAKFPIIDNVTGKAAFTYYKYTGNSTGNIFTPQLGANSSTTGGSNVTGTNDLNIIDIPAEINIKGADSFSYQVFGEYAVNTQASKRYDSAVRVLATLANQGKDDNAWSVGGAIKSQAGKTYAKGDWNVKAWWQETGAYSLDPNTVDSDFMDSRLNMKGVVAKGEYLLRDNVFLNFSYGHAERKNKNLGAIGSGDIAKNIDNYNLYQLDLTYKF